MPRIYKVYKRPFTQLEEGYQILLTENDLVIGQWLFGRGYQRKKGDGNPEWIGTTLDHLLELGFQDVTSMEHVAGALDLHFYE